MLYSIVKYTQAQIHLSFSLNLEYWILIWSALCAASEMKWNSIWHAQQDHLCRGCHSVCLYVCMIKCLCCTCEPSLLLGAVRARLDALWCEWGRTNEGGSWASPPPVPPSLGRDKVNSGITVRPDAGMLIAVDRSSKQCVLLSQVECHSEWRAAASLRPHLLTTPSLPSKPGCVI